MIPDGGWFDPPVLISRDEQEVKASMHNVQHEIKGDKLIITVDGSEHAIAAAPPSSSGKTNLVASTGGSISVPSPSGAALSFSVNVMAKKR